MVLVKKGSFAKVASPTTTQSVDVGFPMAAGKSFVILWCTKQTAEGLANQGFFAIGYSDGTNHACVSSASNDNADTSNAARFPSGQRVLQMLTNGTSSSPATLAFECTVAFTATGFDLTYQTNDANQYLIHYVAVSGLKRVEVGNFALETTAGNTTVTQVDANLKGNFVMFLTNQNANSANPTASGAHSALGIGAASVNEAGVKTQWSITKDAEDGKPTSDTWAWVRQNSCIITLVGNTGAVESRQSFTQFNIGSFQINVDDAGTSTDFVYYLVVEGGKFWTEDFTKTTSIATPVTQQVTGVGFKPDAVMMFSIYDTVLNGSASTSDAELSVGGGTLSDEGYTIMTDEDQQGFSDTYNRYATDKVFALHNNNDGALISEADLSSVDRDGFTLSWTTQTDTTAKYIETIAIGDDVESLAGMATRKRQTQNLLQTVNDKALESTKFIQIVQAINRLKKVQGIFGGLQTLTTSYTIDMLTKALNISDTYSIDMLTKAMGLTSTYDLDALIKAILTTTYTVDALVKAINLTDTYSLDTLVKALNLINTYDIDVMVKTPNLTTTYSIDELVKATLTDTYTLDTLVKSLGLTTTYSIDVLVKALALTTTYDLDVLVKAIVTNTYLLDMLVKALGVTSTYDIDMLVKALNLTSTYNIDLLVKSPNITSMYSIDMLTKATLTDTYALDTLVKALGLTSTYNIDALVKSLALTTTYDIDTLVKAIVTNTYLLDMLVKALGLTSTYDIDMLIKALNLTSTYNLDLLVKSPNVTTAYSLDTLIKSVLTNTYNIDMIVATVGFSTTYSIDLLVKALITNTYDIDTLVKTLGLTSTYTQDTMVKGTLTQSYEVDANVKAMGLTNTYLIDMIVDSGRVAHGTPPLQVKTWTEEDLILRQSLAHVVKIPVVSRYDYHYRPSVMVRVRRKQYETVNIGVATMIRLVDMLRVPVVYRGDRHEDDKIIAVVKKKRFDMRSPVKVTTAQDLAEIAYIVEQVEAGAYDRKTNRERYLKPKSEVNHMRTKTTRETMRIQEEMNVELGKIGRKIQKMIKDGVSYEEIREEFRDEVGSIVANSVRRIYMLGFEFIEKFTGHTIEFSEEHSRRMNGMIQEAIDAIWNSIRKLYLQKEESTNMGIKIELLGNDAALIDIFAIFAFLTNIFTQRALNESTVATILSTPIEAERNIPLIWISERDEKVCPRCQNIDGQSKLPGELYNDVLTGVSVEYPPLHPNCRCRLLPLDNERVFSA